MVLLQRPNYKPPISVDMTRAPKVSSTVQVGDVRFLGSTDHPRYNFIIAIEGAMCYFLIFDDTGTILGCDRQTLATVYKRPKVGTASIPSLKVKWI